MFRWYLMTHNYQAYQLVCEKLEALGVECFSASIFKMTRRSDSSGHRTKRTQLFPGYLFVRIDPEILHTSTIANLPGVKEFVRFGGEICTVSDGMVEALKQSILLRPNKKVTAIEYANVTHEVIEQLQAITLINCVITRRAALLTLLQNDIEVNRGVASSSSCVSTVLESPYVSDLIN